MCSVIILCYIVNIFNLAYIKLYILLLNTHDWNNNNKSFNFFNNENNLELNNISKRSLYYITCL